MFALPRYLRDAFDNTDAFENLRNALPLAIK
jgi:hypothetical protein